MIHPRNPGQALDTGPGLAHTEGMSTNRTATPAETLQTAAEAVALGLATATLQCVQHRMDHGQTMDEAFDGVRAFVRAEAERFAAHDAFLAELAARPETEG